MNENRYNAKGILPVDYIKVRRENPKGTCILLHGFSETSQIMLERFESKLIDFDLISINGIFPIPKKQGPNIGLRYAWYFYDNCNDYYYIDYSCPVSFLKTFINSLTIIGPLHIIGFSQGGYLAPFLAFELDDVDKVIGIGCRFKQELFIKNINFDLYGIYGEKDKLINFENAQSSTDIKYISIAGLGHEINEEVITNITSIIN